LKPLGAIKRLGYEASTGWTTYSTSLADFHNFRAARRDMKAPLEIDRIYKIYRIDFLPPHPVNLVNPVYFHCFGVPLIAT
jgi:hypothetical protein